jgi:hypothetical protein
LNAYYTNPYYYNPYYGNPYFSGVVYGNVSPVYNKPRRGNMQVYGGNGNAYSEGGKTNRRAIGVYQNDDNNYRNSNKNAGAVLRNVFGSGNSNNSSTTTSQPSSTNSSSSSSSSSGSSRAPVRKF